MMSRFTCIVFGSPRTSVLFPRCLRTCPHVSGYFGKLRFFCSFQRPFSIDVMTADFFFLVGRAGDWGVASCNFRVGAFISFVWHPAVCPPPLLFFQQLIAEWLLSKHHLFPTNPPRRRRRDRRNKVESATSGSQLELWFLYLSNFRTKHLCKRLNTAQPFFSKVTVVL